MREVKLHVKNISTINRTTTLVTIFVGEPADSPWTGPAYTAV